LPASLQPRAVQVSSVDGFQGCEKELILISTVRSNPERQLGFLSDFRRLNVAVSTLSLYVEYAEREKEYGFLFAFSLFCQKFNRSHAHAAANKPLTTHTTHEHRASNGAKTTTLNRFCEYIHLEHVRIHVIYRVNQAEYGILIRVLASRNTRIYIQHVGL